MAEGHKKLYIGIGAGVGVLALAGVGLRLHALAKARTSPLPAQPGQPTQAIVQPSLVQQVAAPAVLQPAAQAVVTQNLAAAALTGVTTPQDISSAQLLASQVDPVTAQPISTAGQQAVVTTNDPIPAGDLIIFDAPDNNAPQVGGAEKNGTVTVLDDTDPLFAKIVWAGGPRLDAATGFVHKAFLRLV